MCLLIFKPAGKRIPVEFLQNAEINNPHGSGIAIAKDNKLSIHKSAKWGADEISRVLLKNVDQPAIVHFRWATHGRPNFANTHPFQLNDNWVAAHNGVIPDVDTLDDESDTRAFLRQNVIPLLACSVRLDDKDILTLLGKTMGSANKMTFLSADGSYGIANESSGHWLNGVWYSNHTYTFDAPVKRKYRTYSPFVPTNDIYMGGIPNGDFTSVNGKSFSSCKSDTCAPSEDDTPEEIWHTFDITRCYCDNCNQRVIGEFRIEQHSGLLYCHRCLDQI